MLLLVPAVILYLSSIVDATPTVIIGPTTVTGITKSSGVDFFGGIPFAEPPLGLLRFRPPVKLRANSLGYTFNATSFGPACLQTDTLPPGALVSEDCLQLNVFRPTGIRPGAKLPVMFWIYGGGFTSGETSAYNATGLVQRSVLRKTPIIVVSVNYRLGPLGFPQGIEAQDKKLTNLGLIDQVAGLQWVQANIGNFGGDNTKVTIFGESAGATAVFTLIMGDKITGLARAAISESTGFLPTWEANRNEALWQTFVSAVPGCASVVNSPSTINCLRSVSTEAIMEGLNVIIPPTSDIPDTSFFPNVDGPGGFLPDRLSKLTPKLRLPLMIGNNLDEGSGFTPQDTNSEEEIRNQIVDFSIPALGGIPSKALTNAITELLRLYPDNPALGSPFGTGNNTFGLSSEYKRYAALYGDFVFQATRRNQSMTMSANGIKVFGYEFTDPDAIVIDPFAAPGSLGIPHASELSYIFSPPTNPTPSALKLSSTMQDYWISFAATLDPNDGKGNTRPQWVPYTTPNPSILKLDGRGIKVISDDYRQQQMSFIASNPQIFGL